MKRLLEINGVKRVLLTIAVYLSFCLNKLDTVKAIFSINNIFYQILICLGYGLLFWLMFEILIGIFYSALKSKIENYISIKQFYNIFRYLIIILNLILFIFNKIWLVIGFYTVYLSLLFNILIYFLFFIFGYLILNKYYIKNTKIALIYFEYSFIFLILYVILWGVL